MHIGHKEILIQSLKDFGNGILLVPKAFAELLLGVLSGTLSLGYKALKKGDKYIGEKIGERNPGTVIQFISDKILRTLGALGVAGGLFLLGQNDFKNFRDNGYYYKDGKYIGVDVSEHNENDPVKFLEYTMGQGKKNRPSFAYIKMDSKMKNHLENFRKYSERADCPFAVGCYYYLDKSEGGILPDSINYQVENFIKAYVIVNKSGDGLIDLIPMLDFEFLNGFIEPNTVYGERIKLAVLRWLSLFQQKTGVMPGIYCNAGTYVKYFKDDLLFKDYKFWIAKYSENALKNFNDSGLIVHEQDTIRQVGLLQYSNNGKVPGLGDTDGNTDLDVANNIGKLFIDNEDRPKLPIVYKLFYLYNEVSGYLGKILIGLEPFRSETPEYREDLKNSDNPEVKFEEGDG